MPDCLEDQHGEQVGQQGGVNDGLTICMNTNPLVKNFMLPCHWHNFVVSNIKQTYKRERPRK